MILTAKISSSHHDSAAYDTVQLDPASVPAATNTVMWLESCTKLIITVVALQYVERGLFALDSPADMERLLPEWRNRSVSTEFGDDSTPNLRLAKATIALRYLLTHTSGIAYDAFVPEPMSWRWSCGEGCFTA